VVAYLTEGLLAQGHRVTVFASADSRTRARLIPCCPRALRLDPACRVPLAPQVRQLELVARHAHEFDLIHFHIDLLHYPLARRLAAPSLTTLHGRLDLPELVPLCREFADVPVVSISDAQRAPLPWLPWLGTVYHGLPPDAYRLHEAPGGYLAFLGRICPEKRPDRAIEIARRAGRPLWIAAKVDPADQAYYAERIRPLLQEPGVEFLGEIGEAEKAAFLGNAAALLFPIDWPEPFGLAMIEAMACGTPVIAFRCGSVPEIVEEGVSGFIVDSVAEAVTAVPRAARLSRRRVRAAFERRFTVPAMVERYLGVYERLLLQAPASRDRREAATAGLLGDGDRRRPVGPAPAPPGRAATGEAASGAA